MTESEYYDLVRATWLARGWPWWDAEFDLNVGGVRNDSRTPDAWDDVIFVAYKDPSKRYRCERFVATTDPGGFFLQNPLTSLGTIVVEEAYHSKLWSPGKHGISGSNPYDAMVQTGKLKYRRDNDRDLVIEQNGPLIDGTGNGVNLHHGYGSKLVGRNSAGCQVVRMPASLLRILALVEAQRLAGHGSSVSYGLGAVETTKELRYMLMLGA